MGTGSKSTGLFVTLEGGEGSGKTTQIKMLAATLTAAGHEVITSREPGGTAEAEKIRDLLVQRDGGDWSAIAECLLLFAARHMHYETLIKPALARGAVVISDRFTDSTRAYQGYGMGMDLQDIEIIKQKAIGDVEPDVTFIMDIPVQAGLERSMKRLSDEGTNKEQSEDRYEARKIEFHEKLRQGYLMIAKQNTKRCHVIDAAQNIEDIQTQIMSDIKGMLS